MDHARLYANAVQAKIGRLDFSEPSHSVSSPDSAPPDSVNVMPSPGQNREERPEGRLFPFRIRWKRVLQVVFDAALLSLAIIGAYLIRFDGRLSPTYSHQLLILAPALVVLRLAANWLYGVYRRLWRYTGLAEVVELGLSIATVTTLFMIVRAAHWISIDSNQLSYGIIFIEAGLAF